MNSKPVLQTTHDLLARSVLRSINHTAPHLGHVQIHRQLWLAERPHTP